MKDINIAVIGLGYVGLPLARLFSTKYPTVGYDLNPKRVEELMSGHDSTLEVDDSLLQSALANGFRCTTDLEEIRECNFYVVAVPTPVDKNNNPDLRPLYGASETVGKVISKGDIVVYESTVYPGVTENECVPIVERVSGLTFNRDFFAGYSPERINPGDKEHTVEKIKKVTSGSTPETARMVDAVYASVSRPAHTWRPPSRWPKQPKSSKIRNVTSTSHSSTSWPRFSTAWASTRKTCWQPQAPNGISSPSNPDW